MGMAYRDTPVGFHRVLKGPMDDREVFKSNIDLLKYCNEETAYVGQRVVVTYDGYDQQCIIRKGNNDSLVPILDMGSSELIIIKHDSDYYALVMHYIGTTIAYTDKKDRILQLNDPDYYAILPMAGIIANNDEAINYMLEVNDDEPQFITQGNPVTTESSRGFKSIYDRAIENMEEGNVVRLWVQCNDYYKTMGGTV